MMLFARPYATPAVEKCYRCGEPAFSLVYYYTNCLLDRGGLRCRRRHIFDYRENVGDA